MRLDPPQNKKLRQKKSLHDNRLISELGFSLSTAINHKPKKSIEQAKHKTNKVNCNIPFVQHSFVADG